MALKNYTVKIGGLEHTLQLSEDDARRLKVSEAAPAAPAPKGRKPRNKAAAPANDKAAPAADDKAAPASDDTDW